MVALIVCICCIYCICSAVIHLTLFVIHTQFNLATSDELDQLSDDCAFSTLLNHSSWRLIEHVNMGDKHALWQQMILEEVIIRRKVNLKAVCGGLQVLGLCDLLGHSPQLLQPLFVAGASASITAQQISGAISLTCPTHDQEKSAAYIHFKTLLTLLESVCI